MNPCWWIRGKLLLLGLLEAISKTFGKPVFSDVSLSLQKGEFVSIVGRSGCGKTTLLEVLAGLQAPTHGAVRYADNTKPPVLVFQEFNRSIFRGLLSRAIWTL
ncbi:MAG: ATP-binding cassette domain-containing protein [Flavobacteriales bacterium]|nr:ATP-binding cassette domain-containing protein [Flavobacteriales bacterium]